MREDVTKKELSERTVWVLVAVVFLSLSAMLAIVFNNEKTKPQSPHALVASAFNQHFAQVPLIGSGQMPIVNQTIYPQQPVWRPLPARTGQLGVPPQIGQGNSYPQGLVFQKIIR
jgi:hypothetical protein